MRGIGNPSITDMAGIVDWSVNRFCIWCGGNRRRHLPIPYYPTGLLGHSQASCRCLSYFYRDQFGQWFVGAGSGWEIGIWSPWSDHAPQRVNWGRAGQLLGCQIFYQPDDSAFAGGGFTGRGRAICDQFFLKFLPVYTVAFIKSGTSTCCQGGGVRVVIRGERHIDPCITFRDGALGHLIEEHHCHSCVPIFR